MSLVFQFPRVHASLLEKWLVKSRMYAIEYGGFLSNHLTHNMVAIASSGHSQEDTDRRLRWWYEVYSPKLEPSVPSAITITSESWATAITDDVTMYPAFLKYFDHCLEADETVEDIVRRHVEILLVGLSGAALHPLIHTGWALEAANKSMLAEGLAYMSCRYVPLLTLEALQTHTLFSSAPIACETELEFDSVSAVLQFSIEAAALSPLITSAALSSKYQHLNIGSFQRRMRAFSDEANSALIKHTLSPQHTNHFICTPLSELIDELIAIAASAYLASDCEFFVLHGVTSLHGAIAIAQTLDNETTTRQLLMLWLHAELAVYTCQGLPGSLVFESLLSKYRVRSSDSSIDSLRADLNNYFMEDQVDECWWRSALDASQKCEEEHVSKAVYVMWRWAHMPGISPASALLCSAAAANQMRKQSPDCTPEDNIWFSTGAGGERA